MEAELAKARFGHDLQKALTALYDPPVLRNSPLAELFDIKPRRDTASALRRFLIDAIESLRPSEPMPAGTRTWRVYQILRRRYTEQLTQHEVAANLGFSIRQLQREEKAAREVLADSLWIAHRLMDKARLLVLDPKDEESAPPGEDAPAPTLAQELAALSSSFPPQTVQPAEVVRDVLETIQPLLTASNVAAQCEARGPVPAVFAPVPIWRQAVLGIVNLAIYSAPGGRVHITLSSAPPRALIRIQAFPPAGTVARAPSAGDLETAWQLLELCHGELEVDAARDAGDMAAFAVTLSLPAAEQITVLVVDDNADTRLLLQRYLSGTRYHFAGAHTSQQGMALAEELSPRVIVLDVMMPKQDGWALLGYLREHPKLRSVPVVVTTILAEEKLALALGAADFMRKPIKRSELLAVLDRHLSAPQPESG